MSHAVLGLQLGALRQRVGGRGRSALHRPDLHRRGHEASRPERLDDDPAEQNREQNRSRTGPDPHRHGIQLPFMASLP